MSHIYWDNFVNDWRNNAPFHNLIHINNWTMPNQIPLMNSIIVNDYSSFYLPEPWWGNDGKQILNSVVINYNPGGGGLSQHYQNCGTLYGYSKYSHFVNSEATGTTNHFRETNKWHKARRSKRVFNTLSRIGIDLNGFDYLHNHLSIELIPWHTKNTRVINTYIKQNLQAIYDYCIVFAANEATRIANDKLNSKVILRISGDNTIALLKNFAALDVCHFETLTPINYVPNKKAGYFKFAINNISEIEFISIWGTRNDFPSNENMDWIFNNII